MVRFTIFLAAILILLPSFNLLSQDDEYSDDEYYYDDGYYEDEEQDYNDFMATVQIGYKLGLGNFGNFYGNAFGFFGMFEYKPIKNLGIGIKTGYIFFRVEGNDVQDEWGFNSIPVYVTAMYYFQKYKNLTPYAGIELGPAILDNTYYQFLRFNRKDNKKEFLENTKTGTGFGYAPTIGLIMPFGAIKVNVNVKYGVISVPQRTLWLQQDASYLGINIGVAYQF